MAKSGTIKIPDSADPGDNALADLVVESEAPVMNLGAAVALVLEKATDEMLVSVDLANRKIKAVPFSGGAFVTTGSILLGTLTRDDPTKRSSPWTIASGGDISGDDAAEAMFTAIATANATAKPARSLASQLSVVEDALAGLEAPPSGAFPVAIVSQDGDGSIKIYVGSANPTTALTGTDPAVIEQVLATTDVVPPLAFE